MNQQSRIWRAARWFGGMSLALLLMSVLAGCSSGSKKDNDSDKDAKGESVKDHDKHGNAAEIKAERDKLEPDVRILVDEQDACPIMPDSRLGSMGQPVKLTIRGQTVFVCCKGCVRKAERKPDETLTKVAELKAKNKAVTPK